MAETGTPKHALPTRDELELLLYMLGHVSSALVDVESVLRKIDDSDFEGLAGPDARGEFEGLAMFALIVKDDAEQIGELVESVQRIARYGHHSAWRPDEIDEHHARIDRALGDEVAARAAFHAQIVAERSS